MELIEAVKEELGTTLQDTQTDERLLGYIARGKNRLEEIAGKKLDFDVEDEPRRLLLDYCRYANSQALEVFEHNFLSDLLSLHLKSQVVIPIENQNADRISDL